MSQGQMGGQAAPVATCFLTCHGTVVRVDRESGQLMHAHLWPVRAIGRDWDMALPAGRLDQPMPSPLDARVSVVPAPGSRLVSMCRGGDYLCAERHSGEVGFNRPHAGPWETFLAVSATELAVLRLVLSHEWIAQTDDGRDAAPAVRAWLGDEFMLTVGAHGVDLREEFPPVVPDGGGIRLGRSGPSLRRGAALAATAELELMQEPGGRDATLLADPAAWRAAAEGRLVLRGGTEYGFLPLAVRRAHEEWMLLGWSHLSARRLGKFQNRSDIVRQRDRYVLMMPRRAGVIFDAGGVANDTTPVRRMSIAERGVLAREGGHIFVSREALERAPFLAGPHAIFSMGSLTNYYQWLVDGLLRLQVMAPYLPDGTTLPVPGLAEEPSFNAYDAEADDEPPGQLDHAGALQAWGFGGFPVERVAAPVCRVEEVYWLDHGSIDSMPAELVQAARRDVLARLGGRGPGKSIYVKRAKTRTVANAASVEAIARNAGISVHELDGMAPRAQMELFRDADFVVAAHGAELANLLFCAPGTKVLELAPANQFRPNFAQISDKLHLVHAVLPCPTDDGGFSGRLEVDEDDFRLLLRMLRARQ